MVIEWSGVRDEVTTYLQALLRINTVNPPGNETAAAQYLATVATAAGIPYEIVEGAPGRGNFVARLRGDGTSRPVALLGHLDVVGVALDQWTHDPFGGERADGWIWGRGALDMKNQVAVHLMVLLLLHRQRVPLTRDVLLIATADEEVGGWGAEWLWAHRRDLLDAEYAINEFGGHRVVINGKAFYTVQAGEKGTARMRISARGTPGHASLPRHDTAISRLARALTRLDAFEPPTIITDPVARFLHVFAHAHGEPMTGQIKAILRDPTWEALAVLPLGEEQRRDLYATTRNTAVPTMLSGGEQINVIPSEAWVEVDGRILPGQDAIAWVRQVQAAVGDEVEVQLRDHAPGVAADPHSPFYEAMAAVMADEDPGAGLLPMLVSGGTDAAALPGIKVYGFLPSRVNARELHGHDERTSVEDLEFATRCLYQLLLRFCAV